MTSEDQGSDSREVVVTSGPSIQGSFVGHFGESEFPVGGPDGLGHLSSGPNLYDLLGASLAACTAMTIRFQAHRQMLSLDRVDVGITFRRGSNGERDWFERAIILEGNLNTIQHAFLLEAANLCPVGKILGIGADIRTRSEVTGPDRKASARASYDDDLAELNIPYLDAD